MDFKPGDKIKIKLDAHDIHTRGLKQEDFDGRYFVVATTDISINVVYVAEYGAIGFHTSQCTLAEETKLAVGDFAKVINVAKGDTYETNAIVQITKISGYKVWISQPNKPEVWDYAKNLEKLISLPEETPALEPTPKSPMFTTTDLIAQVLTAGESPILVGPTGSGKTHVLTNEILVALNLTLEDLTIIQVSRETSRYDLLGYKSSTGVAVPGFLTARLSRGSGLIIIDELDKGNENTLLVLKGYFAGYLETPCGNFTIDKSKLFLAATANTVGAGASMDYNAAVRQDQALLNEFILIPWDYQEAAEKSILETFIPKRLFYLDNSRLVNLYLAAFRELRELCKKNNYTEIFSTRQLRQACSLMLLKDWNFSAVIKATSLREADVISAPAYDLILTKYDAAFRLTDTVIAERQEAEVKKKAEQKEWNKKSEEELTKSSKKFSGIFMDADSIKKMISSAGFTNKDLDPLF